MTYILKALFSALLLGCLGAQSAVSYVSTKILPADTILPLVELDDKGQVATCGLVASAFVQSERFEVRAGIKRDPPTTTFFFKIKRFSVEGAEKPLGGIQSWLPLSKQSKEDAKVASFAGIASNPDEDARRLQGMMVGGFRAIIITTPKDAKQDAGYSEEQFSNRLEIEIKGPLPQNVRATYLNCTGDMYRQE